MLTGSDGCVTASGFTGSVLPKRKDQFLWEKDPERPRKAGKRPVRESVSGAEKGIIKAG